MRSAFERRPHRGEHVAAPPHAGVHRQRHRDAVLQHLLGGRVPLPGAALGLGRHRDGAAGRGDPLVAVPGEGRGVHVHGLRGHEAVLVHQPDAVVVGRAPDAGVRGHRDAEVAGHLERRLLREGRVAGDVERHLHAHHVVARRRAAAPAATRTAGSALHSHGPAWMLP